MLAAQEMKPTPVAPPPVKELPQVRAGAREDLPQILMLCAMLHKENGVFGTNPDWMAVGSKIEQAINGAGATIGVIGDTGRIEGAVLLQISTFWYSQDPMLEELFNYVHPDYRRSDNAKALIEFTKRCSVFMQLPLLIGVISNERTEQKVRLYSRRLGPPAGAYFLVNGSTGGN